MLVARHGMYNHASRSFFGKVYLNRAVLKMAYQSSIFVYDNVTGYPTLGVDNNDGDHFKKDATCTHTKNEHNPWWVVDLQDNFYVSFVNITNRADCCREYYV